MDTNYFYDGLKSIEYLDKEVEMFDIEVEVDHAFVANGFVCHNCQGMTFKEPIEFGAWQWIKNKRVSLKNHPGSLYVMLSRNTSLQDLYFDTSFGKDEALNLLKAAVVENKNVLKYVKSDKPIYEKDELGEYVVVELEDIKIENIGNNKNTKVVTLHFRSTKLEDGEDNYYIGKYIIISKGALPILFWEYNEKTKTKKVIKNYRDLQVYPLIERITKTWMSERYKTYLT
jgi:hypothetical protein